MTREEIAIIKDAQQGNILAFETLVKKYDRQVMQLAFQMLQNTEDAEDIYQEVFVRIYKKLRRFHFRSEFSTWLYRVVVNTCINYQKKKQRKRAVSIDRGITKDDDNWKLIIEGKEKNPEETVLNAELSTEIKYAIEQLSEKQKTVFVLKHFHGMKLREIAEVMKCTEGTVKNYLFRATQKLQKLLKTYSTI